MKKVLFLLGLTVVAVEPSASFANLALDMPPILAKTKTAKCTTSATCSTGQVCCEGTCVASDKCCGGTIACSGGTCCNNKCYYGCIVPSTCQACPIPVAGGLNDTCISSKVGSSGQEDADFGRDASSTTNNDSDGHKGFNFTKLDSNCNALTDQTQTSFAFIKDNVTGLVWEIQADPFERPWYNESSTTNGGDAGGYNGGSNTQSYVATANTAPGWCSKTDWRMPTIKELAGLINSSKTDTATDGIFFPNIKLTNANSGKPTNAFFWSSTPVANDSTKAWALNFKAGVTVRLYNKTDFNSVMLVRKAN